MDFIAFVQTFPDDSPDSTCRFSKRVSTAFIFTHVFCAGDFTYLAMYVYIKVLTGHLGIGSLHTTYCQCP